MSAEALWPVCVCLTEAVGLEQREGAGRVVGEEGRQVQSCVVCQSVRFWGAERISLLASKLTTHLAVRLIVTPWTAAYQAPPSMGFSTQEPDSLPTTPKSPPTRRGPPRGTPRVPAPLPLSPFSPPDRDRSAAAVWVSSRGTMRISGSLSCSARLVRSPCA